MEEKAIASITRRLQSLSMDIDSYISGFVDGEGCFCVSFQPGQRHRLGWEARASFSVSQNADRAQLLHVIKERWGCGSIRPDRSDRTVKFEVRKVSELVGVVIPHFERRPLMSSKQQDFELFRVVCSAIAAGDHHTREGFERIVRTAMKMNSSGRRKYSADEILNSLRSDEGIVYARG
jgi:hypothetical protein